MVVPAPFATHSSSSLPHSCGTGDDGGGRVDKRTRERACARVHMPRHEIKGVGRSVSG